MIILHHREVMMNEHLLQHLEKLPYFLAIATQRSFHGAARTLRISQSALSRSMKQLENDIGVKLFQRQPRGVCLTPEGEILSQFARLITSQARKVESQILKQNEEIESILRLGAYGTIANQFGPTLLQETYVRHSKTIVHLTIESSGQKIEEESSKLGGHFVKTKKPAFIDKRYQSFHSGPTYSPKSRKN